MRKLKGLESIICRFLPCIISQPPLKFFLTAVTVVSPRMGSDGWAFANADDYPGAEVDPIHNVKHIKEIYLKNAPEYSGR